MVADADLRVALSVNWHQVSGIAHSTLRFDNPLRLCNHVTNVFCPIGELLFVPSGVPHFVQNLENSVSISANYVRSANTLQTYTCERVLSQSVC